jgi:hypothetical protein
MNVYTIKVEKLEDGVKQFCLFDEKEKKVIARYGTRAEAEEVLIRYQSAVDRMAY